MIGKTLAFYFARQFALLVIAIFVFFFFLIFAITYLEFFTRSLRADEFNAGQVLVLTLFRVPSICEEVMPFTTLFGSIAAFLLANRRLEVVIARAAGLSAWQFLLPACIVGLLFGIVATTVYNPISTAPGFSLENVHVMAGVPNIFQAMVASLLPRLTGGRPLLSQTLRIERGEGSVAKPLAALAAEFDDLSFGSYPFIQNGAYGTNIVVRGTDAGRLDAAIARLAAMAGAE